MQATDPTTRAPDRASSRTPDRARLALDVTFALSFLLALTWGIRLATISEFPLVLRISYAVALAAVLALWIAFRRVSEGSGRTTPTGAATPAARRLVLAYLVVTTTMFFTGDRPAPVALFVVGLVLLFRVDRFRWALVAVGAMIGVQAVLLTTLGRPLAGIALELVASLFVLGFGLVIAWLFGEVDRQRRVQAELVDELVRRRDLETELAGARERQRTARDLHDGLGHDLTLVTMSLQYAERMRGRDPDRAWAEVVRAREQTGQALAMVRRLARALHPAALAEGADPTRLAEEFGGTGLDVRVVGAVNSQALGPELEVFRRRFVQEALTNVVRHSSAVSVTVEQDVADGILTLSVRDDGGGEAADGPISPGFGLRSLTERAHALGGHTSHGRTDDGFEVRAVVPLAGSES